MLLPIGRAEKWCVLGFSEADNWIRAAVYDAFRISYSTGETMPSDECRRR